MEEIILTESEEHSAFAAYLYGALLPAAGRGRGELAFGGGRVALRLSSEDGALFECVKEKIAEVVCVGYKYRYMQKRLAVCLPRRERRLLTAALIAADYAGDAAYVRGKLRILRECAVDGFYEFRLRALREKWDRIIRYVPAGFAADDLKKFCAFLSGESRNAIYVKGNAVYGENFTRLKRSRLTGAEDAETEIVLSDAGFIYCLGAVEESLGDFLQNYYAERAIFS